MKVSNISGLFILLLVTIVCVILLALGAWAYFQYGPAVNDQKLHAEIVRLQSAALVYRGRMSNFDGVCKDIGVRKGYDCNESSDAFALSVERHDGSFYCADSSNYIGIQTLPIREELSCKRSE